MFAKLRRHGAAVGAAALLGLGAASVPVVVATPAHAEDGTGGTTAPGTGNFGSGGTYDCKGTTWWHMYNNAVTRWYDYRTACDGKKGGDRWGNVITTNELLCDSGMLVFRFYGSAANPTQAYTVSRANPQTLCDPNPPKYRMWHEVPSDAGGTDPSPMIQTSGDTTYQTDGPLGGSIFWNKALSLPPAGGNGMWSTRPAVTKVGSCVNVQTQNPYINTYREILANPTLPAAQKEATLSQMRSFLYQAFLNIKAKTPRQSYRWYQPLGIDYTQYSLAKNSSTGNVYAVYNHKQLPTYRADAPTVADKFLTIFSAQNCYSPMNFVTTLEDGATRASVANKQDSLKVRALCYIPLQRAVRLDNEGKPNAASLNNGYQAGERFSSLYQNGPYTETGKAVKAKQSTDTTLDQYATWNNRSEKTLNKYRSQIGAWFDTAARQNSATPGPASFFAGGNMAAGVQRLPANPYTKFGNTWFDVNQPIDYIGAKFNVQNNSKCVFTSSTLSFTPKPKPSESYAFSTKLTVENPGFLRAGGDLWTLNKFSVKPATNTTNGVVCHITATAVPGHKVGDICDPGTILGSTAVTDAPFDLSRSTISEVASGGAVAPGAAATFAGGKVLNWWKVPYKQQGAVSGLDLRFFRASEVGTSMNVGVPAASVKTHVYYTGNKFGYSGFVITDSDGTTTRLNGVTIQEPSNRVYGGLQEDPRWPGSITSSSIVKPGTSTSAGWWAVYPVWGAVNR